MYFFMNASTDASFGAPVIWCPGITTSGFSAAIWSIVAAQSFFCVEVIGANTKCAPLNSVSPPTTALSDGIQTNELSPALSPCSGPKICRVSPSSVSVLPSNASGMIGFDGMLSPYCDFHAFTRFCQLALTPSTTLGNATNFAFGNACRITTSPK